MTDVPPANPISRCGACGQEDDHPKHQIAVGYNNEHTGGEMFHEHDHKREGVIYYHFDCPSPWHDLHTMLGVHEDPDTHLERMKIADHHAAVIALAKSGVHGDALRDRITGGNV